jgi:hypothetical protein
MTKILVGQDLASIQTFPKKNGEHNQEDHTRLNKYWA